MENYIVQAGNEDVAKLQIRELELESYKNTLIKMLETNTGISTQTYQDYFNDYLAKRSEFQNALQKLADENAPGSIKEEGVKFNAVIDYRTATLTYSIIPAPLEATNQTSEL